MPPKIYEDFFSKISKERFLGRGQSSEVHERLFKGESSGKLSFGQFSRNEFARLCHALEIVDRNEKTGLPWENWSDFWDECAVSIKELVAEYVARRPGKRPDQSPTSPSKRKSEAVKA